MLVIPLLNIVGSFLFIYYLIRLLEQIKKLPESPISSYLKAFSILMVIGRSLYVFHFISELFSIRMDLLLYLFFAAEAVAWIQTWTFFKRMHENDISKLGRGGALLGVVSALILVPLSPILAQIILLNPLELSLVFLVMELNLIIPVIPLLIAINKTSAGFYAIYSGQLTRREPVLTMFTSAISSHRRFNDYASIPVQIGCLLRGISTRSFLSIIPFLNLVTVTWLVFDYRLLRKLVKKLKEQYNLKSLEAVYSRVNALFILGFFLYLGFHVIQFFLVILFFFFGIVHFGGIIVVSFYLSFLWVPASIIFIFFWRSAGAFFIEIDPHRGKDKGLVSSRNGMTGSVLLLLAGCVLPFMWIYIIPLFLFVPVTILGGLFSMVALNQAGSTLLGTKIEIQETTVEIAVEAIQDVQQDPTEMTIEELKERKLLLDIPDDDSYL